MTKREELLALLAEGKPSEWLGDLQGIRACILWVAVTWNPWARPNVPANLTFFLSNNMFITNRKQGPVEEPAWVWVCAKPTGNTSLVSPVPPNTYLQAQAGSRAIHSCRPPPACSLLLKHPNLPTSPESQKRKRSLRFEVSLRSTYLLWAASWFLG